MILATIVSQLFLYQVSFRCVLYTSWDWRILSWNELQFYKLAQICCVCSQVSVFSGWKSKQGISQTGRPALLYLCPSELRRMHRCILFSLEWILTFSIRIIIMDVSTVLVIFCCSKRFHPQITVSCYVHSEKEEIKDIFFFKMKTKFSNLKKIFWNKEFFLFKAYFSWDFFFIFILLTFSF